MKFSPFALLSDDAYSLFWFAGAGVRHEYINDGKSFTSSSSPVNNATVNIASNEDRIVSTFTSALPPPNIPPIASHAESTRLLLVSRKGVFMEQTSSRMAWWSPQRASSGLSDLVTFSISWPLIDCRF
jgi:hypothetical protein